MAAGDVHVHVAYLDQILARGQALAVGHFLRVAGTVDGVVRRARFAGRVEVVGRRLVAEALLPDRPADGYRQQNEKGKSRHSHVAAVEIAITIIRTQRNERVTT